MMLKVLLLLLSLFALIGTFNSIMPQAEMSSVIETLHVSLGIVPYVGELNEVRVAVSEFLELKKVHDPIKAEAMATEIDQRVNNLEIVKKYCEQNISTLELAFEKDSYGKLQKICPVLKNVSFSKAAQIWSRVG